MNHAQRGAILPTFAIGLLSLILLCGLAVDVGFLYMSRAALSKGSDAAALMGARSYGSGQATARARALAAFDMNYAASGLPVRQVAPPAITVNFVPAADGNIRVAVTSRALFNTFFLRVVPDFARIDVASGAEATRARLIMGLALDRSGSMTGNGGSAALGQAVGSFIDYFDDGLDRAAMASYADHARVDVAMTTPFKSRVRNSARALSFGGWTYSHGGIDAARAQIDGVVLPANENLFKALVFFTDGHANSFLANIRCVSSQPRRDLVLVPGNDDDDFRNPATGAEVDCPSSQADQFFSAKYNRNRTRNTGNVEEEGLFIAERSARQARQAGIYVYAIGLGNDINRSSLRGMANDRSSPSFTTAQPEGLAVFAPTAAELDDVFRQIAARILLRLTQ